MGRSTMPMPGMARPTSPMASPVKPLMPTNMPKQFNPQQLAGGLLGARMQQPQMQQPQQPQAQQQYNYNPGYTANSTSLPQGYYMGPNGQVMTNQTPIGTPTQQQAANMNSPDYGTAAWGQANNIPS